MIKKLFLPIFLILVNCTALNNNVTEIEKNSLSREVSIKTEELLKTVNSNEYSKLEEIFLPTLKNKIILNELKKYKRLPFDKLRINSASAVSIRIVTLSLSKCFLMWSYTQRHKVFFYYIMF